MKRLLSLVSYHVTLALFIFVSGIAFHALSAWSQEPIPRTIISLYDSRKKEELHETRAHVLAAMPLNHLGLIVEQYDLASGLPDIKNRKDVRGVLTWFPSGTQIDDPDQYVKWASEVVDAGKKFVIMGDFAFLESSKGKDIPLYKINEFLAKLGIKTSGNWVSSTYNYDFIKKDKSIVEFEREYDSIKPPYQAVSISDPNTKSYLIIGKKGEPSSYSDLITIGSNGAYAAAGYEYYNPDNEYISNLRQWYINPFEFFRLAFATDDLPKPDTTTIAGRRIYYSHIDGDGWNNISLIEKYVETRTISSEVIMEKAIIPYLDLPVTVSPIAAELDPDWVAIPEGQEVAKKIFALPNVEAGSHTYSHPFDWTFFADSNPQKEYPFLKRYRGKIWDKKQEVRNIFSLFNKKTSANHDHAGILKNNYDTPRAYAAKAFDIDMEINEAVETISKFLPKDKKVQIIQWSGDTRPFEKAIELTRKMGIRNINGGDSRFDTEYPSRMWLSPIGIKVGEQRQIYSSNSNENTYTNLWTEKFHGFRYLRKTVDNTETPIRLKPFNIYYHMYSGERDASLRALIRNLNYARTQEIAPITTSHFAAIGDGFYSTNIIPLGNNSWRIENRGELTTIRFDNHSLSRVDFSKSTGVIGQRPFQGSLYVYLDNNVPAPIVTLKQLTDYTNNTASSRPYLLQSRWQIQNLNLGKNEFSFHTQGFGSGEMQWIVPENGRYDVILPDLPSKTILVNDHTLSLNLPMIGIEGLNIQVKYKGDV